MALTSEVALIIMLMRFSVIPSDAKKGGDIEKVAAKMKTCITKITELQTKDFLKVSAMQAISATKLLEKPEDAPEDEEDDENEEEANARV